jgi:hypothetical protein
MGLRFNPPPGWPLPAGFVPPAGWQPDPSWPPVPPQWELWVSDDTVPGSGLPVAPPVTYPYQPYGQATVQTNPSFNGFAIAGFVLGLISAVLLSVIFSIIGLVQIRRRRQRGKGLAIAGLVLSGVWVVVIVVIAVVVAASQAHRSTAGTITNSGQVDIFSLRVGDCFQNPPAAETMLGVAQVTAVRCATPHNAQVFAQFNATDSTYPGRQALVREAEQGCKANEATSLDKSKITSSMTLHFLFPKPQSWTAGRRMLTCLVVDSTKDLTSSLLAAAG